MPVTGAGIDDHHNRQSRYGSCVLRTAWVAVSKPKQGAPEVSLARPGTGQPRPVPVAPAEWQVAQSRRPDAL